MITIMTRIFRKIILGGFPKISKQLLPELQCKDFLHGEILFNVDIYVNGNQRESNEYGLTTVK